MKLKFILRIVLSVVLAGVMFFCFVAGAPENDPTIYIVSAAGFSLSLSALLCGMWTYIEYLRRKIEKLEDDKISEVLRKSNR